MDTFKINMINKQKIIDEKIIKDKKYKEEQYAEYLRKEETRIYNENIINTAEDNANCKIFQKTLQTCIANLQDTSNLNNSEKFKNNYNTYTNYHLFDIRKCDFYDGIKNQLNDGGFKISHYGVNENEIICTYDINKKLIYIESVDSCYVTRTISSHYKHCKLY